jgi:peptidoglycan hydrolase CwlO-like protein/surface antigen
MQRFHPLRNTSQQMLQRAVHASIKAKLLVAVVLLAVIGGLTVPHIYADNLQDQINQLQADNDKNQSSVDALLLQAKDYQDAVNKLQDQISVVQANIATNQAHQVQLNKEIAAKQLELDAQRKVLGEDLKTMYVSGQLSTLEMLATSKNLNDFVDSDTYRTTVQKKIQKSLAQIAQLQNQLQQQKVEVDILLASQKIQQEQLASDQAKQNELLAYNQAQQASYNQIITANQDKIRAIQLQQAALNLQGAKIVTINGNERGGDCDAGTGNGGYVLASGTEGDVCNAPKDAITDWAGIQNRECTSYAYWYFKRVEGFADFTASGDAKFWIETSNYPVHDWPKVGALGVKTEGQWGHVTIVQAIGPSTYKGVQVPAGQVLTSEMNADLTGKFGYNLRPIATLHYIYK